MSSAAEEVARLEQLRRYEIGKATGRLWLPEPHQREPVGDDWYVWLMLAGRGAGKTDACADYYDRWMIKNPGERGAIIAPTLGDAFEACVYGPSGLLAHNPRVKVRSRAGGTVVSWPNGSESKMFGTHSREDVERLRAGGNRGIVWGEEIAAWKYLKEAWENMEFGLRMGAWPHIIGSTTPKPRAFLKALMDSPTTRLTRASMFDNPHLPEAQKQRLREKYEGTRLARQELYGEYIEDVEGALWTYEMLAAARDAGDVPDMARIVVAVDPSGGDSEDNDEQGIIVAGRSVDGRYWVLDDMSCKLTPDGWGRRAVAAYVRFNADAILWEANYGGAMVESNIKVCAGAMGETVHLKKIIASHGKVARAEPISALYEQHRVSHTEEWEELETQLRTWTADSGWSPDRLDALTMALTDLSSQHQPVAMTTYRTRARIPTGADRFGTGVGF